MLELPTVSGLVRLLHVLRWKIAVALGCLVAAWPILRTVTYLDREYLHERIRETRTHFLKHEDWQAVPPIPDGLDYGWLRAEKLLRIGHALGASGTPLANHLEAIPSALADGLTVLEVDLWLTADGSLRCHHGPGDPGPLTDSSCTFERLVAATQSSQVGLILDIKTDFAMTAQAVIQSLERVPGASRRMIFQLYRPADIHTFVRLAEKLVLAGPIITAYDSPSSLDAVVAGAKKAKVKALAFPFERRAALSRKNKDLNDLRLLTHPIHDCSTFSTAVREGYDGVYTVSGMRC